MLGGKFKNKMLSFHQIQVGAGPAAMSRVGFSRAQVKSGLKAPNLVWGRLRDVWPCRPHQAGRCHREQEGPWFTKEGRNTALFRGLKSEKRMKINLKLPRKPA